jgi:hypothetical protein
MLLVYISVAFLNRNEMKASVKVENVKRVETWNIQALGKKEGSNLMYIHEHHLLVKQTLVFVVSCLLLVTEDVQSKFPAETPSLEAVCSLDGQTRSLLSSSKKFLFLQQPFASIFSIHPPTQKLQSQLLIASQPSQSRTIICQNP